MRKVVVGAVIVLVSCGAADSLEEAFDPVDDADAQGNSGSGGSGNGSGTGTDPKPSFVELDCADYYATVNKYYDTERDPDTGEYVRADLRRTFTTTSYYTDVIVEDPHEVQIMKCDGYYGKPVCEESSSQSHETTCVNPTNRPRCYTSRSAEFSGNTVRVGCGYHYETDYVDPAEEDAYQDYRHSRVYIRANIIEIL